mmetsp:Transcript_12793/g.39291  ORF Transcript_12793/g.39291 Transcript_12793/m.39291 type:complete len:225 (-) Transcript_12793:2410-3084(-)
MASEPVAAASDRKLSMRATGKLVFDEITKRCLENDYIALPAEREVQDEYMRKVRRNYIVGGGLTYAATLWACRRLLRNTQAYLLRHVFALGCAVTTGQTLNTAVKNSALRKILTLNSSPLARETLTVLTETEGRHGPWFQKYGPKDKLVDYEDVISEPSIVQEEEDIPEHYRGYELIRDRRADAVPDRFKDPTQARIDAMSVAVRDVMKSDNDLRKKKLVDSIL